MPELPEVETVRNSLKNLIIGQKVKSIDIYYNRIIQGVSEEEFKQALIGKTFTDILRRGKYLIFVLEDVYLVSHLRMEGKYYYKDDEEINKHEHIVFNLESAKTLRYHDTRKFGTMNVFSGLTLDEITNQRPLNVLGYEPFDKEMTLDYLKLKLNKSNKPIKSVLLDQSVITGLGNIYVDEVCFMCKLHPMQIAKTLSDEDLENIIFNSKIVLNKAIALGGTTIHSFSSDGISGKFQNELLVHTKADCPTCNNKISKIRVGGRGTYYCERCQVLRKDD